MIPLLAAQFIVGLALPLVAFLVALYYVLSGTLFVCALVNIDMLSQRSVAFAHGALKRLVRLGNQNARGD
jgi:hypothetical protein